MLGALIAIALQSQLIDENSWLPIAGGRDGSEWLYRLRDVTDDGRITSVWVKIELPPSRRRVERYSMRLYRINCDERSYRLASAIRYRVNGSVISSDTFSEYEAFSQASPESVMEQALNPICSYARILRQQPHAPNWEGRKP